MQCGSKSSTSLRSSAILGEGECLINFRRSRKKRVPNILMLIYKISCGPFFLSHQLFFHHSFPLSSFYCYFIHPFTHVHLPPPHPPSRLSIHILLSSLSFLFLPSFIVPPSPPFHPSINLPLHPSTSHPFSFPLSHSNSICRLLGRSVCRRFETLLNEN